MPELSTAPADSAVTGSEKLLTLGFENVTVQQVADANESKSTDIASATTTDIGAATTPFVHITGTTTITGLGTVQAGTRRRVVFDGILTLTHNGTSLILPTGANITTAAGDTAVFVSEGSANWRCVGYQRADGTALAGSGGGSDRSTVTAVTPSSGTATFDYSLGDYFTLAPTANVTTLAFSNLPGAGHGASLMIRFTQDSTPRTVTWPASFKWAGGVAPSVSTASGAVDLLAITTFDNGTTWRATLTKAFA
jgi:archaellum component FlaF (FlaF/FlaG flagellin family)